VFREVLALEAAKGGTRGFGCRVEMLRYEKRWLIY
jgi:hypothetical protein